MNDSYSKPRFWLLPVVLSLLLSNQPLVSQTQLPDTLHISITEAVAQALEESEEIAAARAMVDQAASQITQATSVALPQLTGNLTYNRAIKTIFDGIEFGAPPGDSADGGMDDIFGDLPFGRPNTYMANLQLSQLLFAGGTIGAARRIARHFRTAAQDRFLEVESELTLQVRLAYLNSVAAQSLNEIALQSKEVSQAHLRQVELFHQAGTASEFDLLRAQVDLENRDPAVVQTANAAELASLELKRLVNIPANQPIVLTTREAPGMIDIDEQTLAPLVEERPALHAARENVLMREAAISAYNGQRFPSVRLSGNLGFQGFPSSVTPPGYSDWRKDWWIALGVNWTIFSGFRINGEVAQARAELDQAEAEEAQLQEGLEVALAAAMAEYRMARAQIEARQQTERLAERALGLADSRFANGLSTQLEVSDAQLLLDEARVNRVQAMYDYIRALAQLERLSGGRLQLLRF